MRKLVLILLAFIAVVTFIRAFDNTGGEPPRINDAVINDAESHESGGFLSVEDVWFYLIYSDKAALVADFSPDSQ